MDSKETEARIIRIIELAEGIPQSAWTKAVHIVDQKISSMSSKVVLNHDDIEDVKEKFKRGWY